MIFVRKDSSKEKPSVLESEKTKDLQTKLLTEGNAHHFQARVYAHEQVREKLNTLYHHKCGYCESKLGVAETAQVDHYRPKNKLKGEPKHSGYYWLAYEWTNLILSCSKCNRAKSNSFPIVGTRITTPPTHREQWHASAPNMKQEKPLLLHPEIDEPSEHLQFNPSGEIEAKQKSLQGEKTIEVCRLDRVPLNLARKKIRDDFKNALLTQLDVLHQEQKKEPFSSPSEFQRFVRGGFDSILRRIFRSAAPQEEYSLLGQCMNKEFDRFFVDDLPSEEQKKIVRLAYQLVKKN